MSETDGQIDLYAITFGRICSGVDLKEPGNGGQACFDCMSLEQRLVETVCIVGFSLLEVLWGLWKIRSDPASCRSKSNFCRALLPAYMSLEYQRILRTALLYLLVAVFAVEIGYKIHEGSLIFLLNPCHIISVIQIYLLCKDVAKRNEFANSVFRIHLYVLSGAFLAIILPVVNTRVRPFEVQSYWVHHFLIYTLPVYMLASGDYAPEPMSDPYWSVMSTGGNFMYHFLVLQPISMLTLVNLNNMLCPALSDPFAGPNYRWWAFAHQHLLHGTHGKLYQLAAGGIIAVAHRGLDRVVRARSDVDVSTFWLRDNESREQVANGRDKSD